MIDSERFFVWYFVLFLGPLGGVWAASLWRDRKMRPKPEKKRLFRCKKCRHFYETDETLEKPPCPFCGASNEGLKTK